jgi:hypothetical protein
VDSAEYRARARELRELAETTHDLSQRAHLLFPARVLPTMPGLVAQKISAWVRTLPKSEQRRSML